LRVELPEPALIHWSRENWRISRDVMTTAAPFGMHVVDLDSADLAVRDEIVFTLYWNEERR
jgi:glucoamylase